MALQIITMDPVIFVGNTGVAPPANEFEADIPHTIPIPNLPAGARLVNAWYSPLDHLQDLPWFDFIEVDIRGPVSLFLSTRRAIPGPGPLNVQKRVRLRVYILFDL